MRQIKTADRRAFTLVELLAAMAFMAIVVPVTMQALTIANRAGTAAQRKAVAARIADRVLNEYAATAGSVNSTQRGTVREGVWDYAWNIRLDNWREDNMRLVTVEVKYPLQGEDLSVSAATLISMTTR